ncbi:zeta toxin family protein [Enterococcus sp. N249-2]
MLEIHQTSRTIKRKMTEDYSLQYAKENKKVLIFSITEGKEVEEEKTAIFMTGSPGAGKTEAAQTLMALNDNLCVIDADKFRELFPGYVGNNSDEFQRRSALLIHKASYQQQVASGSSFS